ncbi:MAG: ABC-type transport auxiliary lipoprotein family protein [Alphaproteobacteria bacterium]|nr:ABC-type transport auxiliary lipoprotein family protein [Alphaproteobacteria bacterium]
MTIAHETKPAGRWIGALAVLLVAAFALAGCTLEGMLSSGAPAPSLYVLTPKSTFSGDLPNVDAQLVVEVPIASEGLNTHRIALRDSPLTLDFFANARWTERAPQMVQTLLVESFENTGKIVSVARQGVDLRADYALKTELREFQAEYSSRDEAPQVWVRLNAKLVRMPARIIVASQTFEARHAAAGSTMKDVVFAFDDSLNKVLKKSVVWTMNRLR